MTQRQKDLVAAAVAGGDTSAAVMERLAFQLIEEDLKLRKRVIGKALSCAKPGKPFDLMLGHYCA